MSNPFQSLQPAIWHENAEGLPDSLRYGDVYHGRVGALAQARQVFLRGNGLPGRWQGRTHFTICELGFGLGHNFLATWQAWAEDGERAARLHYLAFEAHPFKVEDLRHAWRDLPAALRPRAAALSAAWPALVPGWHRIELAEGTLTLTLAFGDVHRAAYQAQAWVDAFYLDGFAPRRNPAMWAPTLFGQLRRLAADQATAATWCAAGQVRRDLQAAGFLVRKVRGIGGKREMTIAEIRPGLAAAGRPWQARRVAVVGAGLAGAGVAQALARRGHPVSVWDPLLSQGAAHAAAPWGAALIPVLTPDDDTRSRLSRVGLERACARWLSLGEPARPTPCGALHSATSEAQAALQRRALARLQFPEAWARWLDAATAARHVGMPLRFGGIWLPSALYVRPPALVAALLRAPGVVCHGERVADLRRNADHWLLLGTDDRVLDEVDQVVLANAAQAPALLARVCPLDGWPVLSGLVSIAGQISAYAAPQAGGPRCIVAGDGYCLPPHQGWSFAGSTYVRGASDSRVTAAGHRAIARRLAAWLPAGVPAWLEGAPAAGWAGWRAATRDHLPLVGAVPGQAGLWLACAYGSRGTSWAALAGDVIGAWLDSEPLPLERELLHRLRVR